MFSSKEVDFFIILCISPFNKKLFYLIEKIQNGIIHEKEGYIDE